MSDIETGGPAFPTESEQQTGVNTWRYEGMTLRDYFAAKAMLGLMDAAMPMDEIAPIAYEMAGAMLKARAKATAAGKDG